MFRACKHKFKVSMNNAPNRRTNNTVKNDMDKAQVVSNANANANANAKVNAKVNVINLWKHFHYRKIQDFEIAILKQQHKLEFQN